MTEHRSDTRCDVASAPSTGLDRRTLLSRTHLGIGSLALHSVLQNCSADAGLPFSPHARPKAKNVILLTMAGGPSQLDLFDPKPKLNQLNGQPLPDVGDETFAQITGTPLLLGSPYRFSQLGESGAFVSELLPALSGIADELTIVRSPHNGLIQSRSGANTFQHRGHVTWKTEPGSMVVVRAGK